MLGETMPPEDEEETIPTEKEIAEYTDDYRTRKIEEAQAEEE